MPSDKDLTAVDELWLKVDSLDKLQLPQSALDQVLEIKAEAKENGWEDHLIKAVIYENRYQAQLDEDGIVRAIEQMEKEVRDLESSAGRAILHSYLGELYSSYLEQNRWKLQEQKTRSERPGDVMSMSLNDLAAVADEHYLKSLSQFADDQPLKKFTILLQSPQPHGELRDWTLKQLLIVRSLDHYENHMPLPNVPQGAFDPDDFRFLSAVPEFVALTLDTSATWDRKYRSALIYQDALRQYPDWIGIDLRRLQFFHRESKMPDKDDLYESALSDRYQNESLGMLHLAQYYLGRGHLSQAHETCQQVMEKWPDSGPAGHCENMVHNIERPNLNVQMEQVNLPGQPLLLHLRYKNLDKIHGRLVRFDGARIHELRTLEYDQRLPFILRQKWIDQVSYRLPDHGDFKDHTIEFTLDPLEIGSYLLVLSSGKEFDPAKEGISVVTFVVSNLSFTQTQHREESIIQTHDRSSGSPVPGVSVTFYENRFDQAARRSVRKKVREMVSDGQGKVMVSRAGDERMSFKLTRGRDTLWLDDQYYRPMRFGHFEQETESTFFLDRALYRPGQKLLYKGILTDRNEDRVPSIRAHSSLVVSLYDANGQIVDKEEKGTNEFGSFSGSFIIPSASLAGGMSIGTNLSAQRQYFRVEAYKRPTFQIVYRQSQETPQLNDTVSVRGQVTSYAGAPISNARLTYRVVRRSRFLYWSSYRRIPQPMGGQKEIKSGVIATDSEGNFGLDYIALSDHQTFAGDRPVFDFETHITVTDVSGESQSSSHLVTLSEQPFGLFLSGKPLINLDVQTHIAFVARSPSGQVVEAVGKAEITEIKSQREWKRKRYWEKPEEAGQADQFDTGINRWYSPIDDEMLLGSPVNLRLESAGDTLRMPLEGMTPGLYKITAWSQSASSEEIKTEFLVHLVRPNVPDSYVPKQELIQIVKDNNRSLPGDTAIIMVGVPIQGGTLFWQTAQRTNNPKTGQITFKGWSEIRIPVKETDKGGILLHLHMLYQNRFVHETVVIDVPWVDKQLDLQLNTVRNLTKPGAREKVSLVISDHRGQPANVEMLASMYDSSLDQIVPHSWQRHFFPATSRFLNITSSGYRPIYSEQFTSAWYRSHHAIPGDGHPRLNWFGFPIGFTGMMQMEDAVMVRSQSAKNAPPPERLEEESGVADMSNSSRQTSELPRSNFAETLLFYPELKADSDGKVEFDFVMNDALTTWKLMLFAHDERFAHGYTEVLLKSQKELMVTANKPRFLRSGDRIWLGGKIDNLRDEQLSGRATLELTNSLTGVSLEEFITGEKEKSFHLDGKSSTGIFWRIEIPANYRDPIEYQLTAVSDNHSDAEKGIIPVLENRTMVTTTRASQIPGGEVLDYDMNEVTQGGSSVSAPHKLVVEITPNPIWYAVKALPYLIEYPHECSEQILNRLYAYRVGHKIVNGNPKIKAYFDQWEGKDLTSSLLKDQDLKQAMIEETPWVREAIAESEQMAQLASYFDFNHIKYESTNTFAKLQQRQNPDGGFPWFGSGPSDRYITQYIVEGLIDLLPDLDKKMQQETRRIIDRGYQYLDEKVEVFYHNLQAEVKKGNTKWDANHLRDILVHYLYVRHKSAVPTDRNLVKIHQFILDQAERYWNSKSLFTQAIIAQLCEFTQRNELRSKLVSSFRERIIKNPDLGWYWLAESGYRWWENRLETQTKMIEIFEDEDDLRLVDELKRWILNNKRTNHWDNTKTTVAAIKALMTGTDWASESSDLQIEFDHASIKQVGQTEAGSLFRKYELLPEALATPGTLRVINPGNQPSWISIYYQYFEDLDQVSGDGGSALKIRKMTFKETIEKDGPRLQQLEGETMHRGEVITVQLEIETDREMDYVHLKDLRGAALEPVKTLSGYRWSGGLGFYETNTDLGTHFFIDHMPRGRYTLQYSMRINQLGNFSSGFSTLQSMYAPEFSAHSSGERIEIEYEQ